MTSSTALVTIDTMPASEARMLHMEVKNRGRGEVSKFIEYETAHTPSQYYYRLRKKGVMPFKANSGNKNIVAFKSSRSHTPEVQELQDKIKQLEMALEVAMVSPAKRALEVLVAGMDEIGFRSRSFLASIVAKDYNTLTPKQEKWLSDLEKQHS